MTLRPLSTEPVRLYLEPNSLIVFSARVGLSIAQCSPAMAISHGLLCDKLSWEDLEPLAAGLWGSVFKSKQQDLVVKISKDTSNALFDTEKKVYEALGRSCLIASYHGTTLVIERDGSVKPGLIIQHYDLRTLKDFLNNPAASTIYDDHDQRLR